MAEEIRCPGEDLERMLYYLREPLFSHLLKEQDPQRVAGTKLVRGAYYMGKLGQTGENLKTILEGFLESFGHQDKVRIMKRLFEYGKTRDEMIKNLGMHVREHHQCQKVYESFLDDIAYTDRGISEEEAREKKRRIDEEFFNSAA